MASLIKIYKDDPTDGGTDGTLVSDGDGSEPIESGALKANENEESGAITLAVRCDSGYTTVEDGGTHATISIEDSGSTDKWRLALTSGDLDTATWGDPLEIDSAIDDTNTLFYAEARAVDTEDPVNDETVDIQVVATIGEQ